MFKILVLEDGYEAANRALESFEDLKRDIEDLDTYGVGGCSCCVGGEWGIPLWTHKKSLEALLETSESWSQLRDGLVEVFGELAEVTPKGVAITSDVDLDEAWVTYVTHEEG